MKKIVYEVREIKNPEGKILYGVFERGKTGMVDCLQSKLYAEKKAEYYTNLFKNDNELFPTPSDEPKTEEEEDAENEHFVKQMSECEPEYMGGENNDNC